MKKTLLLMIPILFLTGCGAEPVNKTNSNNTYYIQGNPYFDFYVDKETCVEYIYSYKGDDFFMPRLNTNGTLKLNETCLKDKGE